jgi:hypothetical protein
MAGIQVAGKLGATNETTSAEEIFFQKYVKPRQKALEDFWNEIMKYNDLGEVQMINNNVFNTAAIDSKQAGIDTEKTNNDNIVVPK